MKTLKQQLLENVPVLSAFIDGDVVPAIIKSVKEWLEQKRQQYPSKNHFYYILIDELLEELKQATGES